MHILSTKIFQAQETGKICSKLKGVGLGNPWISPIDTMSNYASFLMQSVWMLFSTSKIFYIKNIFNFAFYEGCNKFKFIIIHRAL